MQENELKHRKLNLVNSISTAVIAFISFIGLILALTEFLESRKELFGLGWSVLLITTFIFALILIMILINRWIKSEN